MDGQKQGNRLTRRPCKGDELEILIFEAKRQMLVYAGVVKKCLQHGHSFRLASV